MSTPYNQIFTRGLKENLPSAPIVDGKIRFATDTNELFIDFGVTRIQITDVIKGYTEEQVRAITTPLNKIYLASDNLKLLYYSNAEWHELNTPPPAASSSTPTAVAVTAAVGTSLDYARADHVHAVSVASGDSNGQIKVAGINASVTGLGSLAYLTTVGSSNIDSTSDSFDMDFGELNDEDLNNSVEEESL